MYIVTSLNHHRARRLFTARDFASCCVIKALNTHAIVDYYSGLEALSQCFNELRVRE